jgi:Bacterial pre-peptidase C-terminal domain
VFLRVSQITGGTAFAPRIRVFDSGNNLVGTASDASSSSTSSARLDYISEASGTFSLRVDSALAAGTGDYRVNFVRLPGEVAIPAGETGGPLDNEASSDGAIAVGDLDVWTFDANAGDRVTLNLSELTGGTSYSPRARIFDPSGQLVGYGNDPASSSSSSNSVTLIIPSNGTFSVVVDSCVCRARSRFHKATKEAA